MHAQVYQIASQFKDKYTIKIDENVHRLVLHLMSDMQINAKKMLN